MNFEKSFLGDCIGVTLNDRGQDDKHQCFTLLVEDDGNWHEKMRVSSAWLEEAIAVLCAAKAHLDATCTRGPYGYERRA